MPKDKEVKEVKEEAQVIEPQPKPDCPICEGKGFVELAGGTFKVACTCKFK